MIRDVTGTAHAALWKLSHTSQHEFTSDFCLTSVATGQLLCPDAKHDGCVKMVAPPTAQDAGIEEADPHTCWAWYPDVSDDGSKDDRFDGGRVSRTQWEGFADNRVVHASPKTMRVVLASIIAHIRIPRPTGVWICFFDARILRGGRSDHFHTTIVFRIRTEELSRRDGCQTEMRGEFVLRRVGEFPQRSVCGASHVTDHLEAIVLGTCQILLVMAVALQHDDVTVSGDAEGATDRYNLPPFPNTSVL